MKIVLILILVFLGLNPLLFGRANLHVVNVQDFLANPKRSRPTVLSRQDIENLLVGRQTISAKIQRSKEASRA